MTDNEFQTHVVVKLRPIEFFLNATLEEDWDEATESYINRTIDVNELTVEYLQQDNLERILYELVDNWAIEGSEMGDNIIIQLYDIANANNIIESITISQDRETVCLTASKLKELALQRERAALDRKIVSKRTKIAELEKEIKELSGKSS